LLSSSSASCTLAGAKNSKRLMENVIVGLIALALFAYLLFAMIKPENF
jgi:K+-transporting ATPase KdpF subunit